MRGVLLKRVRIIIIAADTVVDTVVHMMMRPDAARPQGCGWQRKCLVQHGLQTIKEPGAFAKNQTLVNQRW
jgi:hypothetical protein